MNERARSKRYAYFKKLACAVHWWPIVGCEQCYDRMLDRIERLEKLGLYDAN